MSASSTAPNPSPIRLPVSASRPASGLPIGVLLVNLGTPDSTAVGDVRRYLREFLSDPRVVDISPVGRWLLLNLIILPFRPKKSAEAYETIWTERGSPLLNYGEDLRDGLREDLGEGFRVELGMRYGNPSIESALKRLVEQDLDRVVVVPLFPQYSSAASGSALDKVFELAGKMWNVPTLSTVAPFYEEPAFVDAFAEVARPHLDALEPDHLLLSYHGVPERQVQKSDPTGAHCLAKPDCCASIGTANRFCYRAHCFATSRALAERLDIGPDDYTVSFQSRLGRTPWIQPYTDELLPKLYEQGVRRLAIMCPAFVADCLETIEEIGIRAKEDWEALGGEALELIPSLNAHPAWVKGLGDLVRGSISASATAP